MGVNRVWTHRLFAPILTFPHLRGKGLKVIQRSLFTGMTEKFASSGRYTEVMQRSPLAGEAGEGEREQRRLVSPSDVVGNKLARGGAEEYSVPEVSPSHQHALPPLHGS